MTNEELIVKGIKEGKTKGQVMADLIRQDTALDLVKAGALYAEVGAKEGLLLSAQEKTDAVGVAAKANSADGKLNRDAAVTALMAAASITKSAATTRLKAYCKDNSIEFPAASRTKRDMTAVHAAYKEWFEAGTAREQIEAGLVQHFGYGEKGVGQAYVKIGKELGLIEGGSAQGRVDLAAWFADAGNVTETKDGATVAKSKADIVTKLMADTEVAKATAETRYGMWLFAVEYHKVLTAPPAA